MDSGRRTIAVFLSDILPSAAFSASHECLFNPRTHKCQVQRKTFQLASVTQTSDQIGCRKWLCLFTSSAQEPALLIVKGSGRFYWTWQHKLAEIVMDKITSNTGSRTVAWQWACAKLRQLYTDLISSSPVLHNSAPCGSPLVTVLLTDQSLSHTNASNHIPTQVTHVSANE